MKKIREYMIERIEASKPLLIEAFTHVYGQDNYEFIKDRINTTKICVCHDDLDLVDLFKIKYYISKNDIENKEEFIEQIDYMIKCKRLYDKFDSYAFSKVQEMFPKLKKKILIKDFAKLINSFDKKIRRNSEDIKKDRVVYFNLMGLNLGENYLFYENNHIAKELIPNKSQIKEFNALVKKLDSMKEKLEEYFSNNFNEIEDVLYSNRYDTKVIQHREFKGNKVSYCMPNSINGEVYPLCVFNLLNLMDSCEMVYVHEFSHSIGISSRSKSNLYCKGKYKYINEALEEASIKEVYDYMLEKGYHIIYKNPGRENDSVYNVITPIGEAFLERFKGHTQTIRFGKEENLYKIVDEETLSYLDGVCSTILDNRQNSKMVERLQKEAIKKIREYTPNNKR